MIILVKLRIALRGHASVPHHDIYAVRNMNLHLTSGNRALINPQAVIKVVGNAGCIRAAHLTLTRQRVHDFVLCVSAQALRKVD